MRRGHKYSTLKTQPRKYARKHGFKKGTRAYNAYVYGTVSRRAAQAHRKGKRFRSNG